MKRRLPAKVRIARFFRAILPAAAILIFGILCIFGFLVYRVSYPGAVPEPVNPSFYLLPSLDIAMPADDGDEIPGWWIPGLKGAPGIVLAPGYGMSRSDALSLANALHENGFNILVYSQRGSSIPPRGACTFGPSETSDMLRALQFVRNRPESNRERMGIWGVDIGALAALRAAAFVKEVRAIAADGAFESVFDFLDLRIDEDSGLNSRLLRFGCRQIFRLVHINSISAMNEKLPLQALADRSILFIKGENRKGLGRLTDALYDEIRPKKEMISFRASCVHLMSGEDLKIYDRQVADFFHMNLQ